MRRVASAILGVLLTACLSPACDRDTDGTSTPRIQPAAPTEPTRNDDEANALLTQKAPSESALPEQPSKPERADLPAPDARRLRSQQKGFVVVTREDCSKGRSHYDLVVHFHGNADAVERQWNEARLDGVLAVANAGTWGRDYKAVYEQPGAYDRLLQRIDAQLAELCPERPSPKRVALSGWSAGYAAIRAMLRDVGSDPIDAVLLSDGLHASLVSQPGNARGVASADVDAFVEFGTRALRNEKLFSITHSSIRTPDYASTTETSDYLLSRLQLERSSAQQASTGGSVELLTEVERAGFRLRGYSGEAGPEHGWHLHALGETLFADLRQWWSR